jgi:hypothetical protein
VRLAPCTEIDADPSFAQRDTGRRGAHLTLATDCGSREDFPGIRHNRSLADWLPVLIATGI